MHTDHGKPTHIPAPQSFRSLWPPDSYAQTGTQAINVYINVPGLVDRFIQKLPTDLVSLLQPHESFIDQTFEHGIQDASSERSVLNWITPLVERCSGWLENRGSVGQHPRTWRSYPNKFLKDTDGTRQLNCAIVSRSSDDSTHTREILVPAELKKTRAEARDADLLLAKQASKIFKSQPTRIYVVGLTLCGSSMRLWQFLIGLVPLALSSSTS
ncbi:FunK1 8 [Puccinia graminis f. sp. tritici CRL 75-36-700-3]|uniref:FunK1 8 n=1 Tax=Puccinia graminis f. sp. tritici (strain CRL 75-36-700-3 / race SCCL) TaxID=418459 RepID=E3L207_PUCGT|nr:FunK1 8 [Puccinia graminis f. sp. tritici CRL 75-36-700-3]EFP90582.2 FunK1 8 [Puccinia graminis f. sp. tritici CRL 75-36-700-3]